MNQEKTHPFLPKKRKSPAGLEGYHVPYRHKLVIFELDDITNTDIHPLLLLEAEATGRQKRGCQ